MRYMPQTKPRTASLPAVRVSEPIREKIEERAAALGMTTSEFLRYVLTAYFDSRERS